MPGPVVVAARGRSRFVRTLAMMAFGIIAAAEPPAAGARVAAPAPATHRASAAAAEDTASGTVLSLSDAIAVTGRNADATSSTCDVYAGTLAAPSGETVNFSVGGVLSDGRLDPQTQAAVDALKAAAARGPAAVATIGYDETGDLCDRSESNLVTSATYVVPPQSPAPPPPAPATPVTPTRGTASGTVTRISPAPALAGQPQPGGTTAFCDIWHGALSTSGGRTIRFSLETPLITDAQMGLHPANPGAARTADALLKAWAEDGRATVTLTYTGPLVACGKSLTRVVTRAAVRLSSPRHQATPGRHMPPRTA